MEGPENSVVDCESWAAVTMFCWEHSWKEVIVSALVLISQFFYLPLSPYGGFLGCSPSRQGSANAILKSGLQVSWHLQVHKAPFTWAEDTQFNFFFFWLHGSYALKDSRSKYRKLIGLNRIFFFVCQNLTKFSTNPLRKKEKKTP